PPFNLFRSFLCWGSIVVLPLAALAGAGFDRVLGGRLGAREAVAGTVALAALLPLLPARSLAWLAVALAVLLVSRIAPRPAIALHWERLVKARGLLDLLDLSCVVVEPGHEQALAALGFAPGGGFADGRRAYVRPPQGMAFLARETRRAESEDAALAAVLDPGFAPRQTVVLERADASVAPAAC